jgi:DNA/RNA-binding domain of Phe-tRNA-synthetase-like protein
MSLPVAPHPQLDLGCFVSEYPRPLGELQAPEWLAQLLRPESDAPLRGSEELRQAIRDLLRHGGFKPTGRSKPASEYLQRAAQEQRLGNINLAVDLCNAVSLHSGLPVSVIDLERAEPPLRVEIAPAGASYVFNSAGQEIDVAGLLCLCDAAGPCANAVKDAQRTKTGATTRRTLSVVWGTSAVAGHTARALAWYRELVQRAGAAVAEL